MSSVEIVSCPQNTWKTQKITLIRFHEKWVKAGEINIDTQYYLLFFSLVLISFTVTFFFSRLSCLSWLRLSPLASPSSTFDRRQKSRLGIAGASSALLLLRLLGWAFGSSSSLQGIAGASSALLLLRLSVQGKLDIALGLFRSMFYSKVNSKIRKTVFGTLTCHHVPQKSQINLILQNFC